MKWPENPRNRILIAFFAVVLALGVLVAWLSGRTWDGRRHILTWSSAPIATPEDANTASSPQTNSQGVATPATTSETPSAVPGASPANDSSEIKPADGAAPPANLIIPVAGVKPDQLRDTFSQARSDGRVHDAIDIPAARGTPVLAAADGRIVRLFQSERGGTTVYQLSPDSKYVYYYAHLERYAEGLAVGHWAKQGETIAYVGDTGNAVRGNYHLHFSIALLTDPKRFWEGKNINPYPLLRK